MESCSYSEIHSLKDREEITKTAYHEIDRKEL